MSDRLVLLVLFLALFINFFKVLLVLKTFVILRDFNFLSNESDGLALHVIEQ